MLCRNVVILGLYNKYQILLDTHVGTDKHNTPLMVNKQTTLGFTVL